MTLKNSALAALAAVAVALSVGSNALLASDCNRNGLDDAADIAAGTSQDCNWNGVPDECDLRPAFTEKLVYPLSQPCSRWIAWGRDTAMVAADIDGDGDEDLATPNCLAASVSVALNQGGGSYAPEILLPVGSAPVSAALADLDQDGDIDIVTSNEETNSVSVLLNQGSGSFSPATDYPADAAMEIACGDLDGDRDADIALCHYGLVWVVLNSGAGSSGRGREGRGRRRRVHDELDPGRRGPRRRPGPHRRRP